jgi:hypothetical protein
MANFTIEVSGNLVRSLEAARRIAGVIGHSTTKIAGPTAAEGAHEIESTVLLRAREVFGDSERALK